jgi:hypothetical protein
MESDVQKRLDFLAGQVFFLQALAHAMHHQLTPAQKTAVRQSMQMRARPAGNSVISEGFHQAEGLFGQECR